MGSALVLPPAGNVAEGCQHLVILQVPALRMRTALCWRVAGQDAVGPGGGVWIIVDKVCLSQRGYYSGFQVIVL